MTPIVLLAPSMAAALELPRRLAAAGRAIALYRFPEPGRDHYRSGVLDLARAVAEPELLGRGLAAWDAGHDTRLAARLLGEDRGGGLTLPADVPRGPVAAALARTLEDLRQAGVPPERLEALADRARSAPEDQARLRALARLYRAFETAREGRVADPGTILRAAAAALPRAAWLQGAEILIVEDLELDEREKEFLAAVARRFPVRLLRRDVPPSLEPSSLRGWARENGVAAVGWEETVLAPLAPPPPSPGLLRLRTRLFEPPAGEPARDEAVELVTAPGEAGEVRALARRLLREAGRGVPFEDMGVVLPRADRYAPLFSDLFERLGIPFQLHPSLPLRSGRLARSLLLLFRSRGLLRASVMEFLTFAPIPFASLLGADDARASPSRWDQISRDARIVSGLDRWQAGLRTHAREEREAADRETDAERAERRRRSAEDAETLLRVVVALQADLDRLDGEAPWPEWAERLRAVATRWLGPLGESDREGEAVLRVVDALAGLGRIDARVPWSEAEDVVEARFETWRLPLEAPNAGAVHVGALDAMAGLPFRVLAIPGLVEGGYPGVLRPDPFLLDAEREALVQPPPASGKGGPAQLALFGPEEKALPTTQDRLREARRLFARALSQATERLILSYPRADPRSGRERVPSLFFVAAASALQGRPLSSTELQRLVVEDEPRDIDDALDASERDRRRMLQDGRAAADAIATGSVFFRQSRWAVQGRLGHRLSAYDGFLGTLDEEMRRRLDPVSPTSAISASRLATFSRCGFQYLLQYVLRLPPTLEPEERRKLEPLERGDLFHRVAERFLRERRDRGQLPVRDDEEARERLAEMAEEALTEHVAGSPPRFRALWEREKRRFHATLRDWLRREAHLAGASTPAHFEVGFGLPRPPSDDGEPHDPEPLEIDLGDGRTLRVIGKIDRIDRREDGGLVLRDYKTGKAPKDEGGLFRGGKQLQVPFYILAAEKLFPGARVVDAFLDYVDGGRQVAVDPAHVRSEAFRNMLRELVDVVGRGAFVQEPAVCDWCDYTAVCGPKGLLAARRRFKISDPELQRVLRARDLG